MKELYNEYVLIRRNCKSWLVPIHKETSLVIGDESSSSFAPEIETIDALRTLIGLAVKVDSLEEKVKLSEKVIEHLISIGIHTPFIEEYCGKFMNNFYEYARFKSWRISG